MALTKNELITLYYVEELPMREIASFAKCSEENVRRLRSNIFELPVRDRKWKDGEVEIVLDRVMPELCTGDSMDGDMRVLSQAIYRKTSDVRRKVGAAWLETYAPNVDAPTRYSEVIPPPSLTLKRLHRWIRLPKRSANSSYLTLYAPDDFSMETMETRSISAGVSIYTPGGFTLMGASYADEDGVRPLVVDASAESDDKEINVILFNHSSEAYNFVKHDPIAKVLVVPVARFALKVMEGDI